MVLYISPLSMLCPHLRTVKNVQLSRGLFTPEKLIVGQRSALLCHVQDTHMCFLDIPTRKCTGYKFGY